MAKIRVYEVARELNLPNKEAILLLQGMGEPVKVASNSIEETVATALRQLVNKKDLELPKSPGDSQQFGIPSDSTDQPTIRTIDLPKATIIVSVLADLIGTDPNAVVRQLLDWGIVRPVVASIDREVAVRLVREFGLEVNESAGKAASVEDVDTSNVKAGQKMPEGNDKPLEEPVDLSDEDVTVEDEVYRISRIKPEDMVGVDPDRMIVRPPVVTIMGHVDHGKTTLLDRIRETNVVDQEAGQITQHIGAYEVDWNGNRIVFIDTPGHEAFTALRQRGTKVTDIVVLVVAADDGIMPQTREAVQHAKAADVPIIVALNKIDRPNADPDRIKQQLTELGMVVTEWGGEVECVLTSALEGTGMDELLEIIALQAELMELKTDPKAPAFGTILETKMEPHRGPVATILLHHGVLKQGDYVVAGPTAGRIRQLQNYRAEKLTEGTPSETAAVFGLDSLPEVGDILRVVSDARTARAMASQREVEIRDEELAVPDEITLEDILKSGQEEPMKELQLIIKTDVQGSSEALVQQLKSLKHPEVKINILFHGLGNINESNVMLAAAGDNSSEIESKTIVLGFNVQIDPNARRAIKQDNLDVRIYEIIYDVITDVEELIVEMLTPIRTEDIVGVAEVRATFRVGQGTIVAGCFVREGHVLRGVNCRILRDDEPIHVGRISSLRHVQEDREEIWEGMECGLGVDGFSAYQENDIIQVVSVVETARTVDEIEKEPIELMGTN